MIRSFRDKKTEGLFSGIVRKGIGFDIARIAARKLILLHAAATLDDLRIPPANRLESLRGDRAGQYSIRVNDRFRICFVWREGHAYDVELTDYH